MARIIGAIASSHTPTIGFAYDHDKSNDPVWSPIFQAYEPIRAWLREKRPGAFVFIYNDHMTSFFFDHYSAFVLGIGERYEVADEGGGPRKLPAVPGHTLLAQHIGASLFENEFDLSFFQDKKLDHGCLSPLSMLLPENGTWEIPIVPLQVGVLQFPIPSARRCYRLGQCLRSAIESFPEVLDVVVFGTGGLSHQVHGERAGFNNTEWDMKFLDLIEKDPEALCRMTHAEYATLGGMEGSEVIMWLIMRGALSAGIRRAHRSYYLPSMTGIATAIYENQVDSSASGAELSGGGQLLGIERLDGTYPFTLARSVKSYRINKFLHDLILEAKRKAFLADETAALNQSDLTEEEKTLIKTRAWREMIHYGVNFFMLEKLSAVIGVSNLHIYAAMRGQTLEEFQKTRNAPGALYSVAGNTAKATDWSAPK